MITELHDGCNTVQDFALCIMITELHDGCKTMRGIACSIMITELQGMSYTHEMNQPLHHLLALGAFCAVCISKLAARLDHVSALITDSSAYCTLYTLSV
jgi:hypothetical protein